MLNRAQIRHPDLLTVGQVLTLPAAPMQPPPRLYKVRRGDTLSGIAEQQLGSANRWPEIFRLNRDIISDPTASPRPSLRPPAHLASPVAPAALQVTYRGTLLSASATPAPSAEPGR